MEVLIVDKEGFVFDSEEDLEPVIQELATADITRTQARGPTLTDYNLEPRLWLKEIVDAGKKRFHYAEVSYQTDIPKGHGSVFIPKRDTYMYSGHADWNDPVTPGTVVNFSRMSNISGIGITAQSDNKAIAVAYDVIQTNAVDFIRLAREELTYVVSDRVDQAIVERIMNATAATSTTKGVQRIYGGDATQTSELSAGNVITTDMVAEASRKLKSTTCTYWSAGDTEYNSSEKKNPWTNDGDFVALISPFEEETFQTDSQFINAAQYGSNEVVLNGEIGKYLGVKILVSNNTKEYAANTAGVDDSTNTSIATNVCVVTKAKKGSALAYQVRPKLRVVDYPRQLETDLIIEQSYGTGIIHDDAIVQIVVAQT